MSKVRNEYRHRACGTATKMPDGAAEITASDPVYASEKFPDSPLYHAGAKCLKCGNRFALVAGGAAQFEWLDGTPISAPGE